MTDNVKRKEKEDTKLHNKDTDHRGKTECVFGGGGGEATRGMGWC